MGQVAGKTRSFSGRTHADAFQVVLSSFGESWGRTAKGLLAAVTLAAAFFVLLVGPAIAAQSRTYTGESLGPDGAGGVGTFAFPSSIAVDQPTGDVYVLDGWAERIYKFNSAGEPVDFSSTGTNSFPVESPGSLVRGDAQIAVAPPGAPGGTGGDIYLVDLRNGSAELPTSIGVYSSTGSSLGRFGPASSSASNACGVATDPAGHILATVESTILEYSPTSNPPSEADLSQSSVQFGPQTCNVGVDGSGNVYVTENNNDNNGLYRLNGLGDPTPTKIGPEAVTLSVDQTTGVVFADQGNEISEYAPGGSTKLGAFGSGQLSESSGVAADAGATKVYVADRGSGRVKVFGGPVVVPSVTIGEASLATPIEATFQGTVDPEGLPITECFFEYGLDQSYGQTAPCATVPPATTGPVVVTADVAGLQPDGATYHFRLVAANVNGSNRTSDQKFVTLPTVQTESALAVTETTATVRGRVFPNELQYSACEFEYGPTSGVGFEFAADCNPTAANIPPDSSFHPVEADLTGLQANNVTYRFRLKATTAAGTRFGKTLTFTTSGDPVISEVRAIDADQSSATLEATLDPRGFDTAYKIEWGTGGNYGNVAARGSLLPAQGPTKVAARIHGLHSGPAYHFRVVASNKSGETFSLDREVEALNACGLPKGRCYELVSPRAAGPVASPGHGVEIIEYEPTFQAAERPGALGYVSEGGYPGATRGGEVFYQAIRSVEGWSNTQLSPPITVVDETLGEHSSSSRTLALSPELSCGVVETNQPLPGTTASMYQVLEAGGENLFRLNPDGSYTPITTVPPDNLQLPEAPNTNKYFRIAGMSSDCARIYFSSVYLYPRTQAVAGAQAAPLALYEWTNGRIRSVGFVPDSIGVAAVAASPGNTGKDPEQAQSARNAVAKDGSRIFFTAERRVGKNPGEVGGGVKGLFVREHGDTTRDVSMSETSIPDVDPKYQWATPDGSRVFFTAPAGLTAESSTEGTDLYEYDLDKEPSAHPLKDLSVNHGEAAADVAGMVGASDDGSRLYFAATGRLVPGKGLSAAENRDEGTWSLYMLDRDQLRFVATVTAENETLQRLLLNNSGNITSEVSAEGRYVLFESKFPATPYESVGSSQVYLFDAEAPSEAITCVSCRPDGQPASPRAEAFRPLLDPRALNGEGLALPRGLVVTNGRPSVIFYSLDPLAPGATEGLVGLYEWSHGQLFLITSEPPGLQQEVGADGMPVPPGTSRWIYSLGSDLNGTDLYFATPTSLTWEDGDSGLSVYDARIGGGFPEPAAPAPACDPDTEGACQGAPTPPPAPRSPQTSGYMGTGNAKPKKCKKGQVKRHGKCKKSSKKHRKRHKKGQSHRRSKETHTKHNRRAGE